MVHEIIKMDAFMDVASACKYEVPEHRRILDNIVREYLALHPIDVARKIIAGTRFEHLINDVLTDLDRQPIEPDVFERFMRTEKLSLRTLIDLGGDRYYNDALRNPHVTEDEIFEVAKERNLAVDPLCRAWSPAAARRVTLGMTPYMYPIDVIGDTATKISMILELCDTTKFLVRRQLYIYGHHIDDYKPYPLTKLRMLIEQTRRDMKPPERQIDADDHDFVVLDNVSYDERVLMCDDW